MIRNVGRCEPDSRHAAGADDQLLLAATQAQLAALAHRLFRDTARLDAADLIQETLLQAFRSADRLRYATLNERQGWLRRVLARKIANALRDRRRAKRDQTRDRSLDAATLEQLGADKEPPPDQQVESKDWAARLAVAITGLNVRQQDAVRLFFWDECSLAEIAARFGCSKVSVGGLIKRALDRLGRLIGGRLTRHETENDGAPSRHTAG